MERNNLAKQDELSVEEYVSPQLFELGDAYDLTLGGKDQTSSDEISWKRDGAIGL